MIDISVNLHMHTPYSDGAWHHDDIARAAASAGLHAICVTDHNVHVGGIEGYRHGVLTLVGEEVHDCLRRPQVSHLLTYGCDTGMSAHAAQPQQLIDAIQARGGLAFPAHPVEYASPLDPDLDAYPWEDWHVKRIDGLEIWNAMTEAKSHLRWPLAPLVLWAPSLFLRGPFAATLAKWDERLARGERLTAIGNSDAHGIEVRRGPLRWVVYDYAWMFRAVNTHVLLPQPLQRDLANDKRMLLNALREGRTFVGYDLAGQTRGFSFDARSGADRFTIGDAFKRRSAVDFHVRTPGAARIRLIRNGERVAEAWGRTLTHHVIEPGAYRVEAHRVFRGALRGWIFSSPIYVQ
jgi:hypothetical protein